MMILFVGEGKHETGAEFAPRPRPARGVLPILARKVCPHLGTDHLALDWKEIALFNEAKKKRGFSAKVVAAIALAWKKKCDGTIVVVDKDRDDTRLADMEDGVQKGKKTIPIEHPAVCGLAVESIEAWTLGAPAALATILGCTEKVLQDHYKIGEVEELYQNSGKVEKRPKNILKILAELHHQKDSLELRESVAEATEVDDLVKHCPMGFKPFADKLKAAFGPH